MDDATFWAIVESGGKRARRDPERQLAAVRKALAKLGPAELVDFHRAFHAKMNDADCWDLWGAAYLLNGGCSDDGFTYFRAWLISRGRAAFEAAVQGPDSLADVADPDEDECEFEDLWGLAQEVYEEKAGAPMDLPDLTFPDEPRGERWDFDDEAEMARRLPRLSEMHS